MDLASIFREHDERQQRLAEIRAQAERDEAQRLTLNARHLHRVFEAVVNPTLRAAADEMAKNGVNARIETVITAEQAGRESLGIQLVHRSDSGARISIARLIYTGNSSTLAVAMEITGSGALSALSGAATLTVDQCTEESVGEHVAGFIRGVLGMM